MEKINKIVWAIAIPLLVSLLTAFVTWTYAIGNKVEQKADRIWVEQNNKELNAKIDTKVNKEDIQQMQEDIKDIRRWVFEMYKENKPNK